MYATIVEGGALAVQEEGRVRVKEGAGSEGDDREFRPLTLSKVEGMALTLTKLYVQRVDIVQRC